MSGISHLSLFFLIMKFSEVTLQWVSSCCAHAHTHLIVGFMLVTYVKNVGYVNLILLVSLWSSCPSLSVTTKSLDDDLFIAGLRQCLTPNTLTEGGIGVHSFICSVLIGLVKKFIWVFHNIYGKSQTECLASPVLSTVGNKIYWFSFSRDFTVHMRDNLHVTEYQPLWEA